MANEVGNAQLAPTKQEVITEIAQRALISASVVAPTIRDFSNRAVKGARTVSIPKYGSLFTVENRASAVAGTNQQSAFLTDQLNLDVRAHIQWLIDSDDEIESTLDVQREYIMQAAMEHGRDFDARCFAQMEADAITTTTAGAPSQDIVLEMRRVLLRNKANPNNLYLMVAPEDEAALLKIDPFVSVDQYGQGAQPLASGVLGRIYGVSVLMSPELASGQYFMYEQDGFGYALQRAPAFDEDKRPEFGVNSMLQVLSQKYGIQSLQKGVPGAFLADGVTPITTEAALIVKDNN